MKPSTRWSIYVPARSPSEGATILQWERTRKEVLKEFRIWRERNQYVGPFAVMRATFLGEAATLRS